MITTKINNNILQSFKKYAPFKLIVLILIFLYLETSL